MKTLVILTMLLFLAFIGCAPKPDIPAEEAAVRAIVVDSLTVAMETNNLDIMTRIVSHSPDNVFFGTDSAEHFVGYESFIDATKRSFASVEPGSQMTLRDVVVRVSKGGDAAWVSYLCDYKGKSQGQLFAFSGLRGTAVLEKQNSKWSIVHMHGSVPVSGQAVKY
jgi:ketosteroid isomerase-like protein